MASRKLFASLLLLLPLLLLLLLTHQRRPRRLEPPPPPPPHWRAEPPPLSSSDEGQGHAALRRPRPPGELPELFTRWRSDGLGGLGLDDVTNGTSPALLERYPRLGTRAPCWAIRNASRCLPSFLLIGTMKAGTTALASYLQLHPDVYMSTKKEPNFFNPTCGRRCPTGGHANNLRFYFSLFPSLDPAADGPAALRAATFEATASYLFSSYHTPTALQTWLPDAKLLVLIRDPVERAYSQYHLGLTLLEEDRARPAARRVCSRSSLEHESFDRLVKRALLRFRDCVGFLERGSDREYYQCKRRPLRGNPCDNVVTASSLLNPGLYAYHLQRFLGTFPAEQLHVRQPPPATCSAASATHRASHLTSVVLSLSPSLSPSPSPSLSLSLSAGARKCRARSAAERDATWRLQLPAAAPSGHGSVAARRVPAALPEGLWGQSQQAVRWRQCQRRWQRRGGGGGGGHQHEGL